MLQTSTGRRVSGAPAIALVATIPHLGRMPAEEPQI